MKSLKPSLREKKRYLLIKGNIKNLEDVISEGIGILGMSKTSLQWIKKGEKSAIVSVNRESVNSIRACLAISPIEIKIEKISGAIKNLKNKI